MSSENKDHLKHKVEFVDSDENLNPDTPYVQYTFTVILTDSLLMFHICHLYHNCLKLIDAGEIKESEIDEYVSLPYILKSVQEALDNRIKTLSSSYIDDNYEWCYKRPAIFDKCLEYFSKIKKELNEAYIESKYIKTNGNVNSTETCNQNEVSDCNQQNIDS